MRFLADENFPRPSVLALRAAGHEVEWIGDLDPGAPDAAVLERAAALGAVLLTFDRDFGALLYRLGARAPAGLAYFRFVPASPREPAEVLLAWLEAGGTLTGRFCVVERERLRFRPLGPPRE